MTIEEEDNEGRRTNDAEVMGDESYIKWKDSWQRWYVLLVFCLESFTAVLVWGTISSAKDAAMGYYNMSAKSVELTSRWVFYLFPLMSIYASWVLTLEHGVRWGMRHIGVLTCIGATIRLLPCFAELIRIGGIFGPTSNIGQALFQIGQIVAALCFPLLYCVPPALSAVWFPAQQRTRATTLGLLFPSFLGISLVHLATPRIAPGPQGGIEGVGSGTSGGKQEYMLSFIILIVAVISVFTMVLSFTVPKWPRYPPSVSAARHRLNVHTVSSVDKSFQGMTSSLHTTVMRWWQALCSIGQYRTGIFTVLSAGFTFSTLTMWQLTLTQVLISSKSAGTLARANDLSLSHLLCALFSAAVTAGISDFKPRKRSVKPLYFFYAVYVLLIGLLLVICAIPPSRIPEFFISKWFVIVHLAGIGIAAGAIAALTFEAATESLYPIQEGLSMMYIVFCGSILILIIELVIPHIGKDAFGSVICFLAVGGSVAAVVFRIFAPTKCPRLELDYGGRMIDYS